VSLKSGGDTGRTSVGSFGMAKYGEWIPKRNLRGILQISEKPKDGKR
jgi:hypothetical protein